MSLKCAIIIYHHFCPCLLTVSRETDFCVSLFTINYNLQCVPRKGFGSAVYDTIYTTFLFLFTLTQTADPNLFRYTHCSRKIFINKPGKRMNIFFRYQGSLPRAWGPPWKKVEQ